MSLRYVRLQLSGSDGSGQTNLTNNPAGDQTPTWSPIEDTDDDDDDDEDEDEDDEDDNG